MTVQLRPNQLAAADAVESAFRQGIMRPLVDSCVGSGKSLTMAELARRAWARGERTIIAAHTRELVEQNAAACRALGLQCGINAAALGERTWRAPVISAAIQSIYKNGPSFGPVAMLIPDECFPADTLVSTPMCDVPIDYLQVGDVVNHALGVGRVEAISERHVTELVEVEFDNGDRLRCTEAHPLFTLQGWQPAGLLETGSHVFRDQGVRELWGHVQTDVFPGGQSDETHVPQIVGESALLLDILLKEAGELHARPGRAGPHDSDDSGDRSSTIGARRQRTWHDEAASGVDGGARTGVGSRIGCANVPASRLGLSDALQTRHCQPAIANRDRSGRGFARGEAETARREKGRLPAFVGVVRVSRIQLASPCAVYNLQVAGHPSYFANGYLAHNCHLMPHSEAGMYHKLRRALGDPRQPGFSGTVFRLQGGSLVEGEEAPFEKVVYRYSILDGIRDGYLVPAFSATADDKIDQTKLRTEKGEYSGASQDAQMLKLMDNHIAQMVSHGRSRRAWLCFEASTKAAKAMTVRLNEWGVPTGLVLGETAAGERAATINAYRQGRLRCLVNVAALTTGFDVQEVDMLVMRRATKSLGLYIQMTGRLLRTIGGNIDASTRAGKADGIVLDFAGNIDQHGPLDFIRPKDTVARLVSCESCGKRNSAAAAKCWACSEPMTKNCPACLEQVQKGTLDCPTCGYDMRTGGAGEPRKGPALLETPSGAALISAWAKGKPRDGGWLPVLRLWREETTQKVVALVGEDGTTADVTAFGDRATKAKWLRLADGSVAALLLANGRSQTSALQVTADGTELPVPMPRQSEAA